MSDKIKNLVEVIKVENTTFGMVKYADQIKNYDGKSWGNINRKIFSSEPNKRPFIRAVKGDTHLLFNRVFECADYFKIKDDVVFHSLKKMKEVGDGWILTCIFRGDAEARKYARDARVSRSGDSSDKFKKGAKRSIDMMDLITKEVKTYPTMAAAAKAHGVLITHIRHAISTKDKISVVLGKYVVVDSGTGFDFLTPTVIERLLKRTPIPVIVFDTENKSYHEYKSILAFIHDKGYGTNRAAITAAVSFSSSYYKLDHYIIVKKKEGAVIDSSLQLILDLHGIKVK